MKKIVLGIFVLLACMSTIFAYGGGDYTGGSNNDFDSNTSATTSFPSPQVAGIRFSFVTSDGVNLGSQDYIVDEDYNIVSSRIVRTTNGLCNKVAYVSGNCSLSWNGGTAVSSIAKPLSTFENFFNVSANGMSYSIPVNLRSAVINNDYTGLFDPLIGGVSTLPTSTNDILIKSFFNNVLSELRVGTTVDDYYVSGESEDIYDLFLIFEPITILKINNTLYMGTAYELAQIAKASPGGGFLKSCSGSSLGAICDLNNVIRKMLPCTSYFTGSLQQQMSAMNSTVLINKFTSTSYFNGAITINYNETRATCESNASSNILPESFVTGNSGVGIGTIWVSDAISGTPTDPPDIPEPPSGKFNCTPYYNVGTCINGDNIEYSDSLQIKDLLSDEYWNNCVFEDKGYYSINPHKSSDKNSALTYYEPSLGSQYCEVYCIETLTTSFASGDITVEAGNRFTWGYSQATGGRTCKTKSVNWSQFDSDLKKANQEIRKSYVAWQVEINKQNGINNATKVTNSSGCGYIYNTEHFSGCEKEKKVEENVYCPSCYVNGHVDTTLCPTKACTETTYECTKKNETRYDEYKYSWNGFSLSDGSYSMSGGRDSWCSNEPAHTANVAGAQAQYNSAVSYAEGLVQAMKKCYTWDENTIYNTNPEATITYSDGKNYNYSGKLDVSTSYSLSNNSVCISQNVNQIKGCDGNSCPSTSVAMQNCGGNDRYVEMTRNATTVFSLNDDIFRYVLKSNNLSIHRFELPKYTNSNFTTNYYDVGESNFPVSYSIPDGLYGSMHGRGNLDLTYSNLGHLKAGQTKTDVDNILSTAESSNYGKWQCEFTVYSKLIPDPNNPDGGGNGLGGIRVVYRTIDLVDPFPDIDGSKRNTGSNWCGTDGNCSYDNSTVKAYINNNRGVSDYDIYSGEPMYTFILTPSIIKEIRKYNSVNSYAEYTGSLSGKNYDYKCNNGKYCISDYLSYLINITGAKDQPGSCVDDKYRNYNDTGNFNACRY